MNSTWDRKDTFQDAFIKNFMLVFLTIIFNYINGIIVFIFFSNQIFFTEARYILYVNLVINDMILLSMSVALLVLSYISPIFQMAVCCIMLIIADTTHKNTPLNLAGMAIERYIAICAPLRHAQVCTARRTYIVLVIIWGVAAAPILTDLAITLLMQPFILFSTSLRCFPIIVFNTPYHMVRITVVLVIYLSFVWLTLIYTYLKVMLAVQATRVDPVSGKKARNTILLHAVQVMLCMLSYIAPWCDAFFVVLFPRQRSTILFTTFFISSVIPRVLTPLIYGIRDQKLFAHMKRYYLCRFGFTFTKPIQDTRLHAVRAQNKY